MRSKLERLGEIILSCIKIHPDFSFNGKDFRFKFIDNQRSKLAELFNDLSLKAGFPNNEECEINVLKEGNDNILIFASENDFVSRYHKFGLTILNYNILIIRYPDTSLVKLKNDAFTNENALIFNFSSYSQILDFILASNDFYTVKSEIERKLILFSEKGPFEVGYDPLETKVKNLSYLAPVQKQLVTNFEKIEFKKFFKEAVIEGVNQYNKTERFYHIVESMQVLLNITERDHDLYLKQFSFEKIKSEFKEKREKYFENIEKNIETVSKQVTSFPLTFAVSIFAGYQVKDSSAILILVFLGYLLYTIIATKVLAIATFNVTNIKSDKKAEADKISNFYGSINQLFKADFDKIDEKISKLESLICYLRIVLWGLLILFFVFGMYETLFAIHTSTPLKVTIVK